MSSSINFRFLSLAFLLVSLGSQVFADDSNPAPVYQGPSPTYSAPNYQPQALFKVVPSSVPKIGDVEVARADQSAYSQESYVQPAQAQINSGSHDISSNLDSDHGGYNSLANTYAGQYQGYDKYEPGYGVQSGYEGYLIPSQYNQLATAEDESGAFSTIWALLPPAASVLGFLSKTGFLIFKAFEVLIVGTVAVLGICTFTPLCTLTINPFIPALFREEVRGFANSDMLSEAVKLLKQSMEKYQKMNNGHHA